MLKRKIEETLEQFYSDPAKKSLLLTGARQVGKTYSVRQFGKSRFDVFVEFNFIKSVEARAIFQHVADEKDILLRISALAGKKLIPGKTLIMFDEVQVCPEILTFVKFLVDEGSFRYILSGSLLGVELKNIRSVPVGYMSEATMYPLDFEEFLVANQVDQSVIDHVEAAFEKRTSPDQVVHERLMRFHSLYLVVGGMPAVVQKYVDTNDLMQVALEQQAIIVEYKRDITQYDERLKMRLRHIYDLIPSELDKRNKRFYLKSVSGRFDRNEDDFVWLKAAGVAMPVFNVDEPKVPLALARKANLFKLFLNDVGLLSSMYMKGTQLKILNGETEINFGAVFENYVAQELTAHGFDPLYYYNSKRFGEVDFLIEQDGKVLPIEVKSGGTPNAHAALDNLLEASAFDIPQALVLNKECKVELRDKAWYVPVYMSMFIKRDSFRQPLIYKIA